MVLKRLRISQQLIFYLMVMILTGMITGSAIISRDRINRKRAIPLQLLTRIRNNADTLRQLVSEIPDVGKISKDTIITRDFMLLKNVDTTDPDSLAILFQNYHALDSIWQSQTETYQDQISPKDEFRVNFHALLMESDSLIRIYNREALLFNFSIKRFPQNIYVNLFQFEMFREISLN